jgi:hypothetical protein
MKGGWVFESRAAKGYDVGHDAQNFYLGLALDPKYIRGVRRRVPGVER